MLLLSLAKAKSEESKPDWSSQPGFLFCNSRYISELRTNRTIVQSIVRPVSPKRNQ